PGLPAPPTTVPPIPTADCDCVEITSDCPRCRAETSSDASTPSPSRRCRQLCESPRRLKRRNRPDLLQQAEKVGVHPRLPQAPGVPAEEGHPPHRAGPARPPGNPERPSVG